MNSLSFVSEMSSNADDFYKEALGTDQETDEQNAVEDDAVEYDNDQEEFI